MFPPLCKTKVTHTCSILDFSHCQWHQLTFPLREHVVNFTDSWWCFVLSVRLWLKQEAEKTCSHKLYQKKKVHFTSPCSSSLDIHPFRSSTWYQNTKRKLFESIQQWFLSHTSRWNGRKLNLSKGDNVSLQNKHCEAETWRLNSKSMQIEKYTMEQKHKKRTMANFCRTYCCSY